MPTSRSDAPRAAFPGGRRFAFSIIDDTDVATLENMRPFYECLRRLGLRTTKTVWPVGCPEGSRDYAISATLEDPAHLAYIRELHAAGFEITWHSATMESSTRERIIRAIAELQDRIGVAPRVHANHAFNRENLYWGRDRLDDPWLRALFGRLAGVPADHYAGHVPGTPHFWGDLARTHVEYVRNLTFRDIDTTAVNPSMPYQDPRRPYGRWWFSASDAEDADAFVRLLRDENLERLESRGGVCIVATHIGKGFAPGGRLRADVEARLEALAARPGWFVPVGPLLDELRQRHGGGPLSAAEWRRMQWRWAWDTLLDRLQR